MARLSRRRFLQGTLEGGAVTIGLPLLNCFLNDSGTALASGAPIPMRFGDLVVGSRHERSYFRAEKDRRELRPARRDCGARAGAGTHQPLHELSRLQRCGARTCATIPGGSCCGRALRQ